MSSSMVSWSGVSRYSKSSGTGRCSELTSATSMPVRSWMCSAIEADVAEGGGHQEEARVRQRDQRDLPGDAALGVRVVVELVHHHVGRVEPLALAQGAVGEHLGGAADHRRVRVDRGVAGQHADVLGAEGRRRGRRTSREASALIGLV